MREHEKKEWKPRKNAKPSNELLESYCDKKGGITFAEVEVPDDPYPRPRVIDGVRFVARTRKLKTWFEEDLEYQRHFSRARQRGSKVEIIEVTPSYPYRGVVGQVVVGAWLLGKQGLRPNMVLVCQEVAPRLRRFLKKHGIEVWTPN